MQFDCPDSVESYIHRVGRSARYKSVGHGLLFLLPTELEMLNLLKAKNIPLKKVKPNPEKMSSVTNQFGSFLVRMILIIDDG